MSAEAVAEYRKTFATLGEVRSHHEDTADNEWANFLRDRLLMAWQCMTPLERSKFLAPGCLARDEEDAADKELRRLAVNKNARDRYNSGRRRDRRRKNPDRPYGN